MSTTLSPVDPKPASASGVIPWRTGAGPSARSGETFDLWGLVRALRRQWLVALVLGVASAAVTAGVTWWVIPNPKYTAEGTVIIQPNAPIIANPFRSNTTDAKAYQRTQLAMLRDRSVLAHALAKPEVAKLSTVTKLLRGQNDPVDWLDANLKAEYTGGSDVLIISLCGDQPKDLADIVNSVVRSYMVLVVDKEKEERQARLDKLIELRNKYQSDLVARRKSLAQVVTSVGSHDPASMAVAQQFTTAQVSLAQAEMNRTQGELFRLRSELGALESEEGGAVGVPAEPPATGPEVEEQVGRDPAVVAAATRVRAFAQKFQEVNRLVRSKGDPALERARRQWQEAHQDFLTAASAARRRADAGLNARAQVASPDGSATDRKREAARLRSQIRMLEGYHKARSDENEKLQAGLRNLSLGSIDVEADREAISIAAEFARKVGVEIEAVRTELNESDRIRIFTPAKSPLTRDTHRKPKMAAVGGSGAFGLVLLGVALLEFTRFRVDAPDDVEKGTGLRLFGSLPDLKQGQGKRPYRGETPWADLLVNAIDETRTALLHASRAGSIRTVLVTSAVKGEAKSSLSSHLATSLARTGRRTLLIDGDLRLPTVHRLFGVPEGPGFCEVLRGDRPVGEVIRSSGMPGLDLLTAGRYDTTAVQALAREEVRALLTRVKAGYDFVIIDSPPVLAVVDPLVLSQYVDGVLFSILRDVSRVSLINAAHERLSALGVNLLGAVVSGVPVTSGGYAYGYGYYRPREAVGAD